MDVTVVGSCNTDLISYVSRLPKPGETIQGSRFSVGFGGKGANQCVTAARLKAKTAMISKVGKDLFGDNTIQNFKDNGINTDYVFSTDKAMTGAAPICVDETGQNSIVIVPGANLLLSEQDLMSAESLVSSSKVVVCQLEISIGMSLLALKMAKKHNIKTIFNPAPAVPELDPEFYKVSDIFCPNETEAEILTGCPVKSAEDAKVAAAELLKRGCGNVVVTLGEMGALLAQSTGETTLIPAPKVKATDSTGAGDSFIGSLAFYISTRPELSLEESVRRAVQIASVSVQKPGTQTSYPLRDELPQELFL